MEEHFEAAGKAVNVARALKRAGVESTAVIAAGRDNWGRYLKAFSRDEIPFRVVFCPGNLRENISLVIDGVEDVTRLMRSGFSLEEGALDEVMGHLSQLVTPHSLVVAAGPVSYTHLFGCLMAVGLTAQVGLQTILNIAVVTNTVPNTGIGLPFFSYGGTALMMLLAQMGIVLSISRQSSLERE